MVLRFFQNFPLFRFYPWNVKTCKESFVTVKPSCIFALLKFNCLLYTLFQSSEIFLLKIHALVDLLQSQENIYTGGKCWTQIKLCNFWRRKNRFSLGTFLSTFSPSFSNFYSWLFLTSLVFWIDCWKLTDEVWDTVVKLG